MGVRVPPFAPVWVEVLRCDQVFQQTPPNRLVSSLPLRRPTIPASERRSPLDAARQRAGGPDFPKCEMPDSTLFRCRGQEAATPDRVVRPEYCLGRTESP